MGFIDSIINVVYENWRKNNEEIAASDYDIHISG